jgi:hypothetical protein
MPSCCAWILLLRQGKLELSIDGAPLSTSLQVLEDLRILSRGARL